jgi:hypothetical protein
MLDVNLEDTGSALSSSSLTASLTASQEQPRKNVLPGPLQITKPAFVPLDVANPEEKENTMTAWKVCGENKACARVDSVRRAWYIYRRGAPVVATRRHR